MLLFVVIARHQAEVRAQVHSGYNFPWSMNNWVPFWGGTRCHIYVPTPVHVNALHRVTCAHLQVPSSMTTTT